MKNNLPIGITFSHLHLEYLGIDKQKALKKALSMKFSHIRLGAYWNEIEKEKKKVKEVYHKGIHKINSKGKEASLGCCKAREATLGYKVNCEAREGALGYKYNFSNLEKILKQCEKQKQPIVMTVGVKAPRWPEFYWPEHIKIKNTENKNTQKNILSFIKKTIKTLQKFSCITHWQIENEPLDPSGPNNKTISLEFLQQEISLVKKLDNRPVIINLWGNDFISRKFFHPTEEIADIIGLDFYPKQFVKNILGQNIYKNYQRLDQTKSTIKKLLNKSTKPIWITELQAEPWEKNEQGYFSKNPKSISPQQLEKNIQQASQLPIKEILLWGFEYWLWQEKNGNSEYLETVKKYL